MTTVNVYPHHDDASAQYRLILPAIALKAAGYDVQVILPKDAMANPDSVRGSDVAVMSRPDTEAAVDMIEGLREQGTRVVVDMDDRLDLVSPAHVMAPYADQLHLYALAGCIQADRVTASTPAVAEGYGYARGVWEPLVLPNRVPARYAELREDKPARIIGWSGSIASHPRDLQETGGMVQKALDYFPEWGFRCVGPLEEANDLCAALGIKMARVTGWVDFADYPNYLCQLGVGIVPLRLTKFNAAKSNLKALEMLALGCWVVASPTPENKKLVGQVDGLWLAKTPADWRRTLRALLPSDRRNTYAFPPWLTIEGSLDQWREAWWL